MQCNHPQPSRRSSLKKLHESDRTSSLTSSTSSSSNNNVSFSSIEMRSYNIIPGDAPTSSGPPVSLDWDYDPTNVTTYNLDEYETYRTNEAPRRNKSELLMPPSHRRQLLSDEWGYSRYQVDAAAVEARRVAENRCKTRKNLKLQPMEEMMEGTKKRLGKLIPATTKSNANVVSSFRRSKST